MSRRLITLRFSKGGAFAIASSVFSRTTWRIGLTHRHDPVRLALVLCAALLAVVAAACIRLIPVQQSPFTLIPLMPWVEAAMLAVLGLWLWRGPSPAKRTSICLASGLVEL